GLAGAARRVGDEVVFQGGVMLVQFAVLARPAQAANPVQAAELELVEVALHTARRDIGELGNVGGGQASALQPQHFHLPLDAGMGVVVTIVANLCQDFLAEGERAHGCLSTTDQRTSNHAVAICLSYGNPANLTRGEYIGAEEVEAAVLAADPDHPG